MALDPLKIPFGLSDIAVGDDKDAIKFDGKDEFQAEGGELTLSPMLEDIVIADLGNGVYDQRVVGWEGTLTIVAAQQTIDILELAIAGVEKITGTDSGSTTGLMDSKIGQSLRTKAKKVTIHPRQLDSKELDITIYKMAANGEYSRSNANEQGNVTIELAMFPRDNMDAGKPGNFFYVGKDDPNAEEDEPPKE